MLHIGTALFYYKLGQTLLPIGAASLLQIRANVVTNWGSYYKLGQSLLQDRAVITNWGRYYRLGQPLLQNKAAITNWGKMYYKSKQENAIRCNNRDSLLELSFTLEISIFSETYI